MSGLAGASGVTRGGVTLEAAARIALACMDLTSLGEADTPLVVADLVARSQSDVGVPAALCVWPRFVRQVAAGLQTLHGGPSGAAIPKVAAVANFPSGMEPRAQVLSQVRGIVADGGHEVDLVLDWRALKGGRAADIERAAEGVRAVRQACRGAALKLIIESGELKDPELIALASRIGLNEGADFLKTSTGKTPTGATPEAARVMLESIAAHPRGGLVGFKASGGVRTVTEAQVYIDLVAEVLGPQALCPDRFRIGASALLADVQAVLAAARAGSGDDAVGMLPGATDGKPAGSKSGPGRHDSHEGEDGGGSDGGGGD